MSYLTERGIIRTTMEFDESALAAALPMSVQSLLTARVDQLAPKDRSLLQAASVIGRQFDSQVLAAVIGEPDVDVRLAAMGELDLVRPEGKSTDYVFKHALVRDALYQSLLTEARKSMHLKIAEEIERRSDNRVAEVAEVLACLVIRLTRLSRSSRPARFVNSCSSAKVAAYPLLRDR